ncbi:MAG: hypothetical protein CBB71_07780 [Rhodopirellula sp. TMED11]|nr:MAG: hypothetical protein CBB71_07780 [Rhodopirellula sp. TMED11]
MTSHGLGFQFFSQCRKCFVEHGISFSQIVHQVSGFIEWIVFLGETLFACPRPPSLRWILAESWLAIALFVWQ